MDNWVMRITHVYYEANKSACVSANMGCEIEVPLVICDCEYQPMQFARVLLSNIKGVFTRRLLSL